MSSDVSLEKHVSVVSAACFFILGKFVVSGSPWMRSQQHFVTSRVDYCNAALAGSPKVTTDKLQRVMNSAARVVSNTEVR